MEESPARPDEAACDVQQRSAAELHLMELAFTELGEIRSVLTNTGKDLESARERCRELSAELESTHRKLSERQVTLDATRETLQSAKTDLSHAVEHLHRATQDNAATSQAFRDHIERLKTQIQSPWRLMIKWCLRRGPYARTAQRRRH